MTLMKILEPILYTDTINGNQVLADNMWAISTSKIIELDCIVEKVAKLTAERDALQAWKDGVMGQEVLFKFLRSDSGLGIFPNAPMSYMNQLQSGSELILRPKE